MREIRGNGRGGPRKENPRTPLMALGFGPDDPCSKSEAAPDGTQPDRIGSATPSNPWIAE